MNRWTLPSPSVSWDWLRQDKAVEDEVKTSRILEAYARRGAREEAEESQAETEQRKSHEKAD